MNAFLYVLPALAGPSQVASRSPERGSGTLRGSPRPLPPPSARKRTVVTPEVGPITLLHMPSEEEILHKFGLAMQAYWQTQANPGCADPGTPSAGCLSPTGLPQVFFDPTGGFGPLTNGQGGALPPRRRRLQRRLPPLLRSSSAPPSSPG